MELPSVNVDIKKETWGLGRETGLAILEMLRSRAS